jgi:hypothetical protein
LQYAQHILRRQLRDLLQHEEFAERMANTVVKGFV